MRQYLLTVYERVTPDRSYALGSQVFDCVPIEQQPGVRLAGLTEIAAPPPIPADASPVPDGSRGGSTAPGVPEPCAAGAIPMRRITLAEVARFRTLRHFFEKGPGSAGQARRATLPILSAVDHAYAHELQNVKNFGGYGVLNLWDPQVITQTPYDQIFSLAQHWYAGGSGAGLQTAEVGWQDYPQKYSITKSVLFIYWTADAYQRTGCYNLECVAFVQTNSSVHLGAGFANYSKLGGTQSEIAVGYYRDSKGNWWLAYNNSWVGYYPGAVYGGGQLSRNAQVVDFGGETVGAGTTTKLAHWPAMGSGQFASRGYQEAAYQRQIVYRDATGLGHAATLTRSQLSPACYTAARPASGGTGWGTYFFFGGPGGKLGFC
jgi:hypothetical protein